MWKKVHVYSLRTRDIENLIKYNFFVNFTPLNPLPPRPWSKIGKKGDDCRLQFQFTIIVPNLDSVSYFVWPLHRQQTEKLPTDRQTDRPTDRPTHRQTDRQTDGNAGPCFLLSRSHETWKKHKNWECDFFANTIFPSRRGN